MHNGNQLAVEQEGPHIPQELQDGVQVIVETKHGVLRGGRTTNGAAIFLGRRLTDTWKVLC